MRILRRQIAVISAILVAVIAAGCGGNDSTASGPAQAPTGEPQAGGRLTVVAVADTATLDPAIDAAIDAGRSSTDPAERRAAYRTVQERLLEQVPFIANIRPNGSIISTPRVGGVEAYGQLSPRVDTLWLDQSGG